MNEELIEEDYTYNTIVNVVQEGVDQIVRQKIQDNSCPPKFIVSQSIDNDSQKLYLTILHNGVVLTTQILPQKDPMNYGLDSLWSFIEELYNCTM